MGLKTITLDDVYSPKTSTKDIVVDVQTGDGQDSSFAIFLGTAFLEANAPANCGTKKDVDGKNIFISATIVDVLKETNWTSMTVSVTEGASTTTFGPYKAQAENHLDTVIYTLKLITQ